MKVENFGQFNKSLIQTYGKNFRHMDTDEVKGFSKEEFHSQISEGEKSELVRKVEDNLDSIDSNADGNLSVKEMVHAFQTGLEDKSGEDAIETVIKDEIGLDDLVDEEIILEDESIPINEEEARETSDPSTILSDILNSNIADSTNEDKTSILEETAEAISEILEGSNAEPALV